ncbi:MAG: TRAP transporter substrate-binding protein DctP [Burkholderiales bacterium]
MKLVTAILVLLLTVGVSGTAAGAVLKIATIAPDGTAWMKDMRAAGAEIHKRTAGRVEFKFYPGGVMGNDATVLRKMQIGQLQGGAVTVLALARVYPDSQLYGLPLLFRSNAEADYVRARIDPILMEGLARHDLIAFGLAEGGFAYLMSSTPVHRIAELKAEKVWAPEGDVITPTLFKIAGIAPVVLPLADVYTGLQTGLITAVGVSASGAIAFQWYTKTKYLTDLPVYFTAGALVLDRRAFERLTPADRDIVRDVLTPAFQALNRANRRADEAARVALKNQGVEFVQMDAAAKEEFERIAAEARAEIGKQGLYTPELLKALEGHLRDFRAKSDGTGRK